MDDLGRQRGKLQAVAGPFQHVDVDRLALWVQAIFPFGLYGPPRVP